MVVESGAYFKAAPRVLKGARPFARDMVGGSVAFLMGEGFAQKAFMGVRTFVSLMVAGRGALSQAAQKVQGDALIAVLSMVEESGASLRIAGRVPKAAQISARPMVGERDAIGVRVNARSLQEARVVYVLLTAAWHRNESRVREVLLVPDSFTGLYLQPRQQQGAAITILLLESASCLIVLTHMKSQRKVNN